MFVAKHAFLDLDATFSVGFIFVLVEAIDLGKNLGLEGINGCRSILRYLADLGNRAAASRLAGLEQMCAHLKPVQNIVDPALQGTSATSTAIGTLTQPFSFATGHRLSVARCPALPNTQGYSTIDASSQQPGNADNAGGIRGNTEFVSTDLARLPLDDIDTLYWTYHPPGLSFTGAEQADWETSESELFQGA